MNILGYAVMAIWIAFSFGLLIFLIKNLFGDFRFKKNKDFNNFRLIGNNDDFVKITNNKKEEYSIILNDRKINFYLLACPYNPYSPNGACIIIAVYMNDNANSDISDMLAWKSMDASVRPTIKYENGFNYIDVASVSKKIQEILNKNLRKEAHDHILKERVIIYDDVDIKFLIDQKLKNDTEF